MKIIKQDEVAIQKKLATKYETVSKEKFYLDYRNYWNEILLEYAPKDRNSFVLDCGCGIGKLLDVLSMRYDNVYGIDLSFDMLKAAHEYNKNTKLVLGDIQKTDFKNESFDMVVCKGSLHHLAEPDNAIREINRILKKKASFVISEPCRDNVIWRKIGLNYVKFSKNFSNYHRLFRSRELKEMMAQNGFEIQKIRYLGFIAFPLCAIAHLCPVMKLVPFNPLVTKILIKIDEIIAKIPLIKNFHWHIIIYSRKL